MSEANVDVVEKKTVFQGYFRIDRYRLRHRRFDGSWSGEMTREIFERGHAVGVLLYDPDRDAVGLIEQFRPGALAAGMHPWLIEIVAGIIDADETPTQVARREAEEEAGCRIDEMIPVMRYLCTPGGSSETLEMFCAKVDSTRLGGLFGLEDEHEDIRVLVLPTDEALDLLESGKITNATSIIALQWLALHRDDLRRRWRLPVD